MTRWTLPLAAILHLSAQASATYAQAPREFVVHVNEPFLTFETAGDVATITSPSDLDGTPVPIERLEAAGVTQIVGTYEGARFVVTIAEGRCEDDMAGLPYSHVAAMSWGDTLKDGCARLATEPQPQEGG